MAQSSTRTRAARGSHRAAAPKGSFEVDFVTPGELLWHEFMEPIGLTKYRVAKEIGVPPQRIGAIIAGKRSITADTDLRLCTYFGLTEGYWLRAQASHDLKLARRQIAADLAEITPLARRSRRN